MPLLTVVLVLICVGVLLWLFNTYVTMIDGKIKQIINVVVIVAVVLWLLSLFGLFDSLDTVRVGRLR
jgi:hypothetical protein